ncbi:tetratricopeptide repeat (TPR)-like superfamily protein isoform X2 [Wolffia australiana]
MKLFALTESGNIHLMLGSFREGVEQFRRALNLSPNNFSVHFGLSSALLSLSKECINYGAFSWATSLLEEASSISEVSCHLAGNYSSSWKLLGDIKIAYAQCLPWVEDGNIGEMDQESFEDSVRHWRQALVSAIESAKLSYQRALHLSPWQANLYTDVANSIEVANTFKDRQGTGDDVWQLPEKMVLGALTLEGKNSDFWLALGCLSTHYSLKQHAFIRGLQLDMSRASAWAFLGKLYRKSGDEQLSKEFFDRARSIDPSLALPWAGMSAGSVSSGDPLPNEAYESCLRAVQLLPLPEYQLGLGKLASLFGHLSSPQVHGAVIQAVQRLPSIPESHNLKGLLCETRLDYPSAIVSYKNALNALNVFCIQADGDQLADISLNLIRSLCKAGRAADAEKLCNDLKAKGLLDGIGHQLYIMALWHQGKKELFLTEAAHLARNIQEMDRSSGAVALALICKLVYCSLGQDQAVRTALKSPRELLRIPKLFILVAALNAFNANSPLQPLLSAESPKLSHEQAAEVHCLQAASKILVNGLNLNKQILSAQRQLRKALHMFPDSVPIRKKLGFSILSGKQWMACHSAIRCIAPSLQLSASEVLVSATMACCGNSTSLPGLSFLTCGGRSFPISKSINLLQKWLLEEPWNLRIKYLLIVTMMQRARMEKYPQNLLSAIGRLLPSVLGRDRQQIQLQPYQKAQLLLCSSEISLQKGDYHTCVDLAKDATRLSTSGDALFFAHLQLCRAWSAIGDLKNLREEYLNCLKLGTRHEIGWVLLKLLESKHRLQFEEGKDNRVDLGLVRCLENNEESREMWEAVYGLVRAQGFIWNGDLLLAEQTLAQVCLLMPSTDRCLLLCHGAVCMELARQQVGARFLSLAMRSLTRATDSSSGRLPVVSALLAQAVASSGDRDRWAENLLMEWSSWPAERRHPEVGFQMHLLAGFHDSEALRSSLGWILRAVHLNPSSERYWKALRKIVVEFEQEFDGSPFD